MRQEKAQKLRRSDVVYVLAKLRVGGADYLLLNAHRKWGDWSLVGGHVEPTDIDWRSAAAREVQEEMAPLRYGDDVEVEPLEGPTTTEWGPVPSASAGGAPTRYRAALYVLRFRADPRSCLSRLSREDFRLFRLKDLKSLHDHLSSIVLRVDDLIPEGWHAVPLSWEQDLDDVPLRTSSLPATPAE